MTLVPRLACLLFPLLLVSCAGIRPQPILSKTLSFTAGDFGPAEMSAPLIGPGSQDRQVLVVHKHQSDNDAVQVLAPQAIKHLNRSVKGLPRDGTATALRARLIRTRSVILDFYNQRRTAFSSVPPYNARSGYLGRQMMMPGIGTTL
ncbi:MAG: hypothetical protein V4662_25980 [Verrucomicrobiota bacterium]